GSERWRRPGGSRRGGARVYVLMSVIVFAEDVMSRLREQHPAYHEAAYLFILNALHYVLERLPVPRHISGRELAEGVRDLAIDLFVNMYRTVLEYLMSIETAHVGKIAFALVECDVLNSKVEKTLEDYEDLFDFEVDFEQKYI